MPCGAGAGAGAGGIGAVKFVPASLGGSARFLGDDRPVTVGAF
jgi:hypothetical protein